MIDIQNLKENLSETIDNLSRRGFEFDKDYWLKTEKKRKKLQVETEQLQENQNNLAREIGKLQKDKKFVTKNSTPFLMKPIESIDIDDNYDLKLSRIIGYKILK